MVYQKVVPLIDMVRLMLNNKDEHSKINTFIDSSYNSICIDLLKNDVILQRTNGSQCVGFFGNPNADIMFVVSSPGIEEYEKNKCLLGPNGEIFNRMLINATEKINSRWDLDNIYYTYIAKYSLSAATDARELAILKSIVDKEIALVKPQVIICMGQLASDLLIHPKFNINIDGHKLYNDSPKLISTYSIGDLLKIGEDSEDGIKIKKAIWHVITLVNDFLETPKPPN